MMEKILLGITAVFPEILRGEFSQFSRRQSAATREIFFAQDALHPDVDRKSAQPFVGEKHDAVGHFRADAREGAKLGPEFVIRQIREGVEIHLAAGDTLRGGEQILRAIAERAGAQLAFGRLRELFRPSDKSRQFLCLTSAFSETFPQRP